jgi:hypothetical protein
MDTQKTNTLNLISSAWLAVMGAIIFVAAYGYARYGSTLLGDSIVVVWVVFGVLILIFFTMPLLAYRRTVSIKTALMVLLLQSLFTAILLVAFTAALWGYFVR